VRFGSMSGGPRNDSRETFSLTLQLIWLIMRASPTDQQPYRTVAGSAKEHLYENYRGHFSFSICTQLPHHVSRRCFTHFNIASTGQGANLWPCYLLLPDCHIGQR